MKVAFDFDGTLVETFTRQYFLLCSIIKVFDININLSRFLWLRRRGLSIRDIVRRFPLTEAQTSEITFSWRDQIEANYWLSLDSVAPGVFSALEKLKSASVQMYVVSARVNESLLLHQAEVLGILAYFRDIISVDPAVRLRRKTIVLEALNVDVFVGDTIDDFQSATDAGLPFYGVNYGQHSPHLLSSAGVVNLLGVLDELPASFCAR